METEEKFGKANLLDDSPPNVVPCGRAPLPLHLGSRVKLNVAWLHKQLLVPLLHLINKDKVYLFTNPGCSLFRLPCLASSAHQLPQVRPCLDLSAQEQPGLTINEAKSYLF